jgi:Mg-chelatase subunit ChlI
LAFHVEVKGAKNLKSRLKIMKQAMEFERDPIYFKKLYEESDNEIARKIIEASKRVPKVTIKDHFLRIVARMCIELDVDGHRPDIIITRAAMTKAAYDGRRQVTEDDMIFASELTLGFRMRRNPFDDAALGSARFTQVMEHAKKLEAESPKKIRMTGNQKKGARKIRDTKMK